MEDLMKHSTLGVHVLFDRESIIKVFKEKGNNDDFLDMQKMKIIQDVMTQLVAKKTYIEKVAYLRDLDPESYSLVVRMYFHIVENSVRTAQDLNH